MINYTCTDQQSTGTGMFHKLSTTQTFAKHIMDKQAAEFFTMISDTAMQVSELEMHAVL